MRNAVCCLLLSCFIFGGMAWRVNSRRANRKNGRPVATKVLKVFKVFQLPFRCDCG